MYEQFDQIHTQKKSILSNGCSSKIETGNVKNLLFMTYTCTNLKSTNYQNAYLKAICIWFLRREVWFCFKLYPIGFGSISPCKQIWKRSTEGCSYRFGKNWHSGSREEGKNLQFLNRLTDIQTAPYKCAQKRSLELIAQIYLKEKRQQAKKPTT